MKSILVWLKDSLQPIFFSAEELSTSLQFQYLSSYYFLDSTLEEHIRLQAQSSYTHHQERLGIEFSKEIENDYLAPSSVRFAGDIEGYGLFAEENVGEGMMIGRYTGIIRENSHGYSFSDYLYSYPVLDEIGRNYVIDAKNGNLTRFINHSQTPNLKPVYAYYDGLYHLLFLALRPIEKGEQFSYNYGPGYWNIRQHPKSL